MNHQANDGLTALIASAGRGSKEAVHALLAAGADTTISAREAVGPMNDGLEPADTALSVARNCGNARRCRKKRN